MKKEKFSPTIAASFSSAVSFITRNIIVALNSTLSSRQFFEEAIILLNRPLKHLLFPIALVADMLRVCISAYSFSSHHAFSVDRFIQLMVELARGILVATSTLTALRVIKLTPPLGPVLLICGNLVSGFHQLSCLLLRSIAKYRTTHPDERYLHGQYIKKHAMNFTLTSLNVIGLSLFFLAALSGSALFAVGIATAITIIVGNIFGIAYNNHISHTLDQHFSNEMQELTLKQLSTLMISKKLLTIVSTPDYCSTSTAPLKTTPDNSPDMPCKSPVGHLPTRTGSSSSLSAKLR